MMAAGCAGSQTTADIAITNATVVDVETGELQVNQTILIADGRIVDVQSGLGGQPAAAQVLDAKGGYLIPGLWDMHVHSGYDYEWHFPLFLAYGVTGIRNMNIGGDSDFTRANEIRRKLSEGEILGPRFFANGTTLDGFPHIAADPVVIRTPEDGRAAVAAAAEAHADFIKVYDNVPREAYFAIVDEARRRNLPVDGHIPFRVRPEEAADAGQRTVEHGLGLALGCNPDYDAERDRYAAALDAAADSTEPFAVDIALFEHEHRLALARDAAACESVIDAYLRNGVAACPNVMTYYTIVHLGEMQAEYPSLHQIPKSRLDDWAEIPPATLATIKSRMAGSIEMYFMNARLLGERGVTLLAGSDAGEPFLVPGDSLHNELMLLVEKSGLDPLLVLQAATINPARVLGLDDELGSVETGKLADLVLLHSNPLENIRNTRSIRAVVADGRLFRRDQLHRIRAGRAHDSKSGIR
jgi:imidazolonepropionase-like amidohydrolase